MIRKSFTKDDLNEVFKQIGGLLKESVEVFMVGGGAMAFRDQKTATKDLDLILKNSKDFDVFTKAIGRMGFKEPVRVETPYRRMEANFLEKNGFRFDLFIETVCGALKLSKSIVRRSQLLEVYGKLSVRIVSNEDVILFKGVTERPDDVNDIYLIIRGSTIDWNVILKECENQSGTRPFYGALYNQLEDLEKKYGLTLPITKKLQKLDEKEMIKEKYSEIKRKVTTHSETLKELKKLGFKEKEIKNVIKPS